MDWAAWRAAGRDRKGRMLDLALFDTAGGLPVVSDPAALKAIGLTPARIEEIVQNAGPRYRGALPPSIDRIPFEPEPLRPIVEPCLWPWPAEWPGEHPWSRLPSAVSLVAGTGYPLSLTLENRGDVRARGRYRLSVVPAKAARIEGTRVLEVDLEPGKRVALDVSIVATGTAATFRVEAVPEGKDLCESALFFAVAPASGKILQAIGEPGLWGGELSCWTEALEVLPSTTPAFLDAAEIPKLRAAAGLPPERDEALLALADEVRKDPALFLFAWYLHWRAFVVPERGVPWGAPELFERLGERSGLFYTLLVLGFAPALAARHRECGYPADVTAETLQQVAIFDRNHSRARGLPGIFPNQFAWLNVYLAKPYVRLGRLEYVLDDHFGVNAWKRRCDGAVLALADEGTRVDDDGLVLLPDAPQSEGWTAHLKMKSDEVCGFPISPSGRILPNEIVIDPNEWTHCLRKGDIVLELHIPSGGNMSPAAVSESIGLALDFFPRHHPDLHFKALVCKTWFLDPRLQNLLDSKSNILRLQRSVYLTPSTDVGGGGLWHVFLCDPLVTPNSELPRDTGMQRIMADFLATGAQWHGGSLFVLADDLNRMKEGLYIRRFEMMNRRSIC